MKFCSISIKNFRNFKDVHIELDNKNVFFGLNDVGKTNFLYALRFLLDYSIRRDELQESDFHKLETDRKIEICLEVELHDDDDSNMLRAELHSVMRSGYKRVFIKLEAEFDEEKGYAIPQLYWGIEVDSMQEMPFTSGGRYKIDNIFDVTYINSYIDLETFFKRIARSLMKSESDGDKRTRREIETLKQEINQKISLLSGVSMLEQRLTASYKALGDGAPIVKLQSGIDFKHEFSGIMPYFDFGDGKLYPTGGDGRKKLLSYALHNIKNEENKRIRIRILLIEEPENHLHKSLQIMLSRMVFGEPKNEYVFLTTHSPYIIQEMDNVNLIRVYNDRNSVNVRSALYAVPAEYQEQKSCLNRALSEALFAKRVLLVEGPSEMILFSKVVEAMVPFYESLGLYILQVDGVSFKHYFGILRTLGIECVVKTDNDLKKPKNADKHVPIGFQRCNALIPDVEYYLPEVGINVPDEKYIEAKRKLYDDSVSIINRIGEKYSIYISRVDLENDLAEAITEAEMNNCLDKKHRNPVSYLQQSKMWNMRELVKNLAHTHLGAIYEHANFKCLKTFCYGFERGAGTDCKG